MQKEFWHDRWENRQIGFHQDESNPYLDKYWPSADQTKIQRVFVPLCGKSLDLIWLSDNGFEVIGVELSQIAVEEFFRDNDLQYKVRMVDKLKFYETENISIICGDFFDLTKDVLGMVSYVFDRASQIAMPEHMRDAYCSHLSAITENARLFVITMEYDQDAMQGPPFSVSEDEINKHYFSGYEINRLETFDLLEVSPHFKEKGLNKLLEKVYMLSPL